MDERSKNCHLKEALTKKEAKKKKAGGWEGGEGGKNQGKMRQLVGRKVIQ